MVLLLVIVCLVLVGWCWLVDFVVVMLICDFRLVFRLAVFICLLCFVYLVWVYVFGCLLNAIVWFGYCLCLFLVYFVFMFLRSSVLLIVFNASVLLCLWVVLLMLISVWLGNSVVYIYCFFGIWFGCLLVFGFAVI